MTTRHRRVSRIILLDESDCILLFLTSTQKLAEPTTRWITPGGGVDPDETHLEGALRELFEETGLMVSDLEGPIHTMSTSVQLVDGGAQTTYAEFFVYRTTRFEISRENWLDYEHVEIKDVSWFPLEALRDQTLPHSPANLSTIVGEYLHRKKL